MIKAKLKFSTPILKPSKVILSGPPTTKEKKKEIIEELDRIVKEDEKLKRYQKSNTNLT